MARPSTYDSYSTTQAPEPSSPWERDILSLQSNYKLDPEMALSPHSIPFVNKSSSMDSHTNTSSIAQSKAWETHSSKEKSFNSDTSPKSSLKLNKKWSMPTPKFAMPKPLKCWPTAPLLQPAKPWMPRQRNSNKRELTTHSIPSYSARAFGMSATTMQWSMYETTSTVNSRREVDRLHRTPHLTTHPSTSTTFWRGSTTAPCATCMPNRSPKTVGTTTGTMSEVAVFTP